MNQERLLVSVKGITYRLSLKPEDVLYNGKYSLVVKAVDEQGREYAAKMLKADEERKIIELPVYNAGLLGPVDYFHSHDSDIQLIPFFSGVSLPVFLNQLSVVQKKELLKNTLIQLSRSLAELHQSGWYHGDLKPGNILAALNENGIPEVKVIDFGKASPSGSIASSSGSFNLQYAAPEIMLSYSEYAGPSSDIYSLALILFEWLEGRHPFAHSHPEMAIHLMMSAPLPKPEHIDPAVYHVLSRALSKPSFPRPPAMMDAEEVSMKLKEATGHRGNDLNAFIDELVVHAEKLVAVHASTRKSWWRRITG